MAENQITIQPSTCQKKAYNIPFLLLFRISVAYSDNSSCVFSDSHDEDSIELALLREECKVLEWERQNSLCVGNDPVPPLIAKATQTPTGKTIRITPAHCQRQEHVPFKELQQQE